MEMTEKSRLSFTPDGACERHREVARFESLTDVWLLKWSAISGGCVVFLGVLTGALTLSPWIIPMMAAWISCCVEFGDRAYMSVRRLPRIRAKESVKKFFSVLFLASLALLLVSPLIWPQLLEFGLAVVYILLVLSIPLFMVATMLTVFVGLPIIVARSIVKSIREK